MALLEQGANRTESTKEQGGGGGANIIRKRTGIHRHGARGFADPLTLWKRDQDVVYKGQRERERERRIEASSVSQSAILEGQRGRRKQTTLLSIPQDEKLMGDHFSKK